MEDQEWVSWKARLAIPLGLLKIRVLNNKVTYQEDQTGTVFRMERIQ